MNIKIAIPVAEGKLTLHFGHTTGFDIFEIADDGKTVKSKTYYEAPPHEPGLLPKVLGEMGVTHIIAGGMGESARNLFKARGVMVQVGAQSQESEKVVAQFLAGVLKTGDNGCDH